MPVTGFPIFQNSNNRNIGNFCNTKIPGAKLLHNSIDEIFDFKGKLEKNTHDVLFIRNDSIHFSKVNELYNC